MEKGKMEKLTDWFVRKSYRPSQSDSSNNGTINVGPVQHFTRVVHVEKDTEGELKGLPEDFQKMIESMTTAKERANAKNAETAKQIIIWNAEQQKKNQERPYKEIQLVGK